MKIVLEIHNLHLEIMLNQQDILASKEQALADFQPKKWNLQMEQGGG